MQIIDSTLRDGEQAPGIFFTTAEKKRIAMLLSESGVDLIEAGIPAMGTDSVHFLKWCSTRGLNASCWCRAAEKDIDLAETTGLGTIHISFPLSDIHLNVFHKSRNWLLDNICSLYDYAETKFEKVNIGFMDISRADRLLLETVIRTADRCGYSMIRLADTAGIMTPDDIFKLGSLLYEYKPKLELHAHNDFGMATANAVTAINQGFKAVSVTVSGIGERAGNARLEEVAAFLDVNNKRNFELGKLNHLCKLISEITGRDIPLDKPVTGKNIFSHKSGIHVAGTLENPSAFMPFNPEEKGLGSIKLSAGSHSGRKAVKHILAQKLIFISDYKSEIILDLVKKESAARKRDLNQEEIERIYYEFEHSRKSAAI